MIRDLLGKRTERKTLNPAMRTMLEGLDGVYEPKRSASASETSPQQEETTRSASLSESSRPSSDD